MPQSFAIPRKCLQSMRCVHRFATPDAENEATNKYAKVLTEQQNVDISSHSVHACGAAILVHTAKQRQSHTGLDVAVPVDGRRDGANNTLCDLKNMMQIGKEKA